MRPTKYPTFVLAVDCNGTIGGGWIDYGKALCTRAPQAHIEAGWNGLNTGVVVPGGPQHRKEREPRMRKTNHVPWMGRTVGIAVVAVMALLGLSGQAEAQAKSFDNYMAWWDTLNCDRMINVVVDTQVDTSATQDGGAKTTLGEFRWCGKWADLADTDQTLIKNAVTMGTYKITRGTTDEVISVQGWWGDLDGLQQCIAVGRTDAGAANATDGTACATGVAATSLNSLIASVRDLAMKAGEALMGESMTAPPTDEEEAPALPLVGVGILGLLLAGRGAWLRRRA